ncbi:MAG: hypothetical protein OQK79_13615 [Rhodanobacter sp.]|nr:hypothetical protein [Rhodanobacter sp.]
MKAPGRRAHDHHRKDSATVSATANGLIGQGGKPRVTSPQWTPLVHWEMLPGGRYDLVSRKVRNDIDQLADVSSIFDKYCIAAQMDSPSKIQLFNVRPWSSCSTRLVTPGLSGDNLGARRSVDLVDG